MEKRKQQRDVDSIHLISPRETNCNPSDRIFSSFFHTVIYLTVTLDESIEDSLLILLPLYIFFILIVVFVVRNNTYK